MAKTNKRAGFTLLEAMIALVVLLVALVGALAGLISASQEFRSGQLRQAEMVLIESESQRLLLSDHTTALWTGAQPSSNFPYLSTVDTLAIGASPWIPDPDAPICVGCSGSGGIEGAPDLSTGAYFIITPDGTITHDTTVPMGKPCDQVPQWTYCREIAVLNGLEGSTFQQNGATQALPLNHTGYTIWIRVSRKGDASVLTVVQRDVWVN